MGQAKKTKVPKWLSITLKIIEWTLILLIVGCMLKLIAQRIVGDTPSLFGYTTYTVVSDSMDPTYKVGDVVICKNIKNPKPEDFEVEEGKEKPVIAFIAPEGFDYKGLLTGQTVTHRIYGEPYEEDGIWYVHTKGDNEIAVLDSVPVPLDNIKGIIVGKSSVIAFLIKILQKWYGFACIIVIPLLAILIWQVIILAKAGTDKKAQKLEEEKQEEIKKLQEKAVQNVLDNEEEIKKKAIEEYIKKNGDIDGSK